MGEYGTLMKCVTAGHFSVVVTQFIVTLLEPCNKTAGVVICLASGVLSLYVIITISLFVTATTIWDIVILVRERSVNFYLK